MIQLYRDYKINGDVEAHTDITNWAMNDLVFKTRDGLYFKSKI